MFMIPTPPSGAASLKEWQTHLNKMLSLSKDEPGREGAIVEAESMIEAILAEQQSMPKAA